MRKIPTKVVVLGPRGTNTEEVALKHFHRTKLLEPLYTSDIPSEFDYVTKKQATYGVVPVENSAEGDVEITMECLERHDLYIIRELRYVILHCLLAKNGKEKIEIIKSHPQALRQCKNYIKFNYPKALVQPASSTAEAARIASLNPKIGAIASERAAEIYGLKIIDKIVGDHGYPITRFFVISRNPRKPKGLAKTSIIVDSAEDRPGVLAGILKEFADRKINLTRIQSYPSRRNVLGEYLFHIDFKGSTKDPKIMKTLKAIERKGNCIKNLGSYSYSEKITKPKPLPSQVSKEYLLLMESSLGFWDNAEDEIYNSM